MMAAENRTLPDRKCGSCTLCCKVMSITALDKAQGVWCKHALVGKGCAIYSEHPIECQKFLCGYLSWEGAGQHWYPRRSKMVLVSELEGTRIAIHVDPSTPNVWRSEPFYSDIKEWARFGARDNVQVVVCILNRAIVIFPDHDVDLGPVSEDERIISGITVSLDGQEKFEAYKLKADDPRLAGMVAGKPFSSERLATKSEG